MKRMAIIFGVMLLLVPVMAHNRMMVKKLDDVMNMRSGAGAQFTDITVAGTAKYVTKLRKAKKGDRVFFQFAAKGDWGPFTGLITLEKGVVVAVDILSFSRHDSDALTRSAFLDQFAGLSMMAFHKKQFKPVPGEPTNLEAVKEALMLAFHDGMGMMNMNKNKTGAEGDAGSMMKKQSGHNMHGASMQGGEKTDSDAAGCNGCGR